MKTITRRITAFNKQRVANLLPHKYKIMTQNMFSFFRGTCHVFYEDLQAAKYKSDAPLSWICGDLHLENFGSYKGSNRLVYFDLNDFDDAILAPASWELVRVVTSIFVAFGALKIEQKKASNMAALFLKVYAETLAKGKSLYIEPQTAKGIVCRFLNKASSKKKKHLVKKRTEKKQGELSLLMDNPKYLPLDASRKKALVLHMSNWIMYNNDSPYNYEVKDAAFRLAGTSSVGLKRYVFLLQNTKDSKSHIMVEMKQASPSAILPFTKVKQPTWNTEAERVVEIQRRMQNVSPAMASTTVFKDEAYLVQEMQPTRDSIDLKSLKKNYRDMYQVINDMALLTASSQLRSAGRSGAASPDDLIAFGTDNSWQENIIAYAKKYALTVRADYKKFKADVKNGLLKTGKK